MEVNGCRRLLVNRRGRFVGIVSLQQNAHELARQGAGRNRFADIFVGLTVAASIAIISLLLLWCGWLSTSLKSFPSQLMGPYPLGRGPLSVMLAVFPFVELYHVA